MIKAEIIADSLAPRGERCTTFILQFPRIVLAEFNTHRMISRNSASSRAVPFKIMLERVQEDPFIPIKWMMDHKGMQGTEYFDNPHDTSSMISNWLYARDHVVEVAAKLNQQGVTKQLCNRLLEPFLWHTVIATATEWENFFALRAHEAAEIHIQDLAYKMLEEYNKSKPKQLKVDEWHIPFGDKMDAGRLRDYFYNIKYDPDPSCIEFEKAKVKIATARCARISYLNFEGKDDYEADIKLHKRLSEMGHWSPFEHCAKAMDPAEYAHYLGWGMEEGWCGNFRGLVQYRKFFEGENRSDPRVDIVF